MIFGSVVLFAGILSGCTSNNIDTNSSQATTIITDEIARRAEIVGTITSVIGNSLVVDQIIYTEEQLEAMGNIEVPIEDASKIGTGGGGGMGMGGGIPGAGGASGNADLSEEERIALRASRMADVVTESVNIIIPVGVPIFERERLEEGGRIEVTANLGDIEKGYSVSIWLDELGEPEKVVIQNRG